MRHQAVKLYLEGGVASRAAMSYNVYMNTCPYCQSSILVKRGHNRSGSQRMLCRDCGRTFTPQANRRGYPDEMHNRAIQLYLEGANLRRIGRLLKVDHMTVAAWVRQHVESLPAAPQPQTTATAEMDELFTFVEAKKTSSTS
jgi:transposase-like protein